MRTKFVEVTQSADDGFNHGKFMVAQFDGDEWARDAELDRRHGSVAPLIHRCGWSPDHVLVFDLQTGEGGMFLPGGAPKADLDKHRIWVCPMFEPFLVWLYEQSETFDWFSNLPTLVEIPDAAAAMQGYRREGAV